MIHLDDASLGQLVAAIGGVGLAAFALVDAMKAVPGGGVSNIGFDFIARAVRLFEPGASLTAEATDLRAALLQTLNANWINGMPVADQKAIARSLIKLQLNAASAGRYAAAANLDEGALREVAAALQAGAPLGEAQMGTLGRFELALTALLDAAYQRADQCYRNKAKLYAGMLAILLSVAGGLLLELNAGAVHWENMVLWALCGVLAVPLAPISKDLTSALAAGVKLAQALRR